MANMSYCRFQNTYLDMVDCVEAINGDELNEMSNREQQGFVDFVQMCKSVAEIFEDDDVHDIKNFIESKNEK